MFWMKKATLFFMFALFFARANADDRVYFTSDRASTAGSQQTQVFSMNTEGGDVRQLTRSHGVKAGVRRCGESGLIVFQNEDALALFSEEHGEEIYLSTKGVQYHSPSCSTDAQYLSVTAWDKVREKGYIEIHMLSSKSRVARWEGEYASWMRGQHRIIYRRVTTRGESAKIDILARNLDKSASPQGLYHYEVGEQVYDISEPKFVGSGRKDFVFRIYDEHEYFYYLGEIGKSFVLTRTKVPLAHHNVYSGEVEDSLEEGQLTIAPNGKFAVITEHPWNTPPILYMVDLRTRDSWKIAEGFNPVWSEDSARIYFNKDPEFYARYHEAMKRGDGIMEIYPKQLDGYEIYTYDIVRKQEKRLTNNHVYDGFL
jgi:Tol biopolymer transport system component